ncbi:hypothetical protein POF45_00395 [Pseudomonas sp. 681]|uniref:Apea-like HEPN domain-containing protein n=1 Tax=Pseudomonas fungipugnans TaxID=3024217 RepID=A0ABT6QGH5_9PSED|nr:hypothetical protein [Pseudomonas sp. 681]MDI2589890.1 hypothetical protein [Pseudomonas sp. 681]
MTPERIMELCDGFCVETASGNYSAKSQKYRLLENGIVFHVLSYDALTTAITGLSEVLLRPGLNTIIDFDHYALWGWCGELLLGPMAQIKIHNNKLMDQEINNLYQICIRAALAKCDRPTQQLPREEQRKKDSQAFLNPDGGQRLKSSSDVILAYLAFPLLEALLKQACNEFITPDSKVIKSFTRATFNNPSHVEPIGNKISSLKILLNLLYDHVASENLKKLIDQYRFHLSEVGEKLDAFELIYDWRCDSLHGNTNFPTIGGVILNLCLLISVYQVKDQFELWREYGNISWSGCERNGITIDNFYPPGCFLPPLPVE